MKYQCARCKEIFTHTAKRITIDIPIPKEGEMIALPTYPTGYEPTVETQVCPFCHNIKFTEYIEPEPEIEDVISVDYVGVGAKISEGYKVKEIYAKTVTLVKPKPKEVQA